MVVDHGGRFVVYGFDTIVALITVDTVAVYSMLAASISWLLFHVGLSDVNKPDSNAT